MSIKFGILYPSRLNLYGDSGNIKALKTFIKREKYVDVIVDKIEDVATSDLTQYDFLFLGSGRENGLAFAEINLFENKKKIMDYVDSGKVMLVTGNAVKSLKHYKWFKVISNDDYYVSDVVATSKLVEGEIRAFQNTKYLISSEDNDNYIFDVEKGYGNSQTQHEGYRYNNLYVTSFIGPILAINAGLRNYIIDRIITENEHNTK